MSCASGHFFRASKSILRDSQSMSCRTLDSATYPGWPRTTWACAPRSDGFKGASSSSLFLTDFHLPQSKAWLQTDQDFQLGLSRFDRNALRPPCNHQSVFLPWFPETRSSRKGTRKYISWLLGSLDLGYHQIRPTRCMPHWLRPWHRALGPVGAILVWSDCQQSLVWYPH